MRTLAQIPQKKNKIKCQLPSLMQENVQSCRFRPCWISLSFPFPFLSRLVFHRLRKRTFAGELQAPKAVIETRTPCAPRLWIRKSMARYRITLYHLTACKISYTQRFKATEISMHNPNRKTHFMRYKRGDKGNRKLKTQQMNEKGAKCMEECKKANRRRGKRVIFVATWQTMRMEWQKQERENQKKKTIVECDEKQKK